MSKQTTVPIFLNFDCERPIGWVTIEDEYLCKFPKVSLSPEAIIRDTNILCSFGLVEAKGHAKAILKYFNDQVEGYKAGYIAAKKELIDQGLIKPEDLKIINNPKS